MKVETIKVESLHLDPANVRKHGERNLDAIKASLAKFGQQKPIVVDAKGVVIAGNGTLAAARSLGWTTVQAVRSNLKSVESTAYAIADNRTAELAEWDDAALAETLRAVQSDPSIDLAVTGFDADEVDAMIERLGRDMLDNEGLAGAIGGLPDGDKSPFQQMTFTVSDAQAETVKAAIDAAKDAGAFDATGNENGNGNALARIAETYLANG